MNKGPIKIEWFMGAQTNLCYNAVDRHVKNGLGGKVAFLYEGAHRVSLRLMGCSN